MISPIKIFENIMNLTEIIKEKIKNSNEDIKKLYFETGNLILNNLEERNYKDFIKNQLEFISLN